MRVFIGHLYHESNTFSPFPTTRDSFEFYEGEEMINKLPGAQVLKSQGVDIAPSIYAARWSSGTVQEDAFLYYEAKLLDALRREKGALDGIWLSVHGGMTVESIGSGEHRLLSDVRRVVGEQMPIALSMDMHANNQEGLENLVNIMNGYHTAPHVDAAETQKKAVRALLALIRSGAQGIHPEMARVPMLLIGERAITAAEPLKTVYDRCRALEADPRIYCATMYVGMAWGDTPNTCVTVAVTPSAPQYADFARLNAQQIGAFIFEHRDECEYAHPSYLPEQAVLRAVESKNAPLYLSDSGDNPTAGGVGDATVLLRIMLNADLKGKRVLFAPIFDGGAVEALRRYVIGETVRLSVGSDRDEHSRPVPVKGELIRLGEVYAYHGLTYEKMANYALLRVGPLDIILSDRQLSFTGMECFESAGVSIPEYDIIVMKMGYMFSEIAADCRENIMALTPGCTPLRITAEQYKNLPRPIWPLDDM